MTAPPKDRTGSRGFPRWTGALVAAVVSILMLLLLEASVRLLHLQSDSFFVPHRHLGWFHRAGATGWYISPEARNRVRINQHGLMGPDRPYEKPAGVRRVLLLGDSFTESMQIPYEQTWARRLETTLGSDWQVLNAGVAGYGTDNELLFLREEGFRYEPDVVLLLFFTGNDVSDNEHSLFLQIGGSGPKPYFDLVGDSLRVHDFPLPPPKGGPIAACKNILRERSRLYLFARERLQRLSSLGRPRASTGDRVPLTWHVYRRQVDPDWERAWLLTAELFRAIQRETDHRGVQFGVASLPTGWRIEGDQEEKILAQYPTMADSALWDFDLPDRRLGSILAGARISYCSLTPALLEASERAHGPLFADHLTERGHQVVADALAEFFRSSFPALGPPSAPSER